MGVLRAKVGGNWVDIGGGGGGGSGGSGFTFVTDVTPAPVRVGDTWFDTSTAATGGTAWIAIEESPGGDKVWVQFAPGSAAPLPNPPAKLYATGFFAAGTALPTAGTVTPPFGSSDLTAAQGLITAAAGRLTINKTGNYLITCNLPVNQSAVGGAYWHTQMYGYGGQICESVDNGAQPYGTSALSVINYRVPVGTQVYVTAYSTVVGTAVRGGNLNVMEL